MALFNGTDVMTEEGRKLYATIQDAITSVIAPLIDSESTIEIEQIAVSSAGMACTLARISKQAQGRKMIRELKEVMKTP